LIENVIVWVATYRPSHATPLVAFVADAHAVLEREAWWPVFLKTERKSAPEVSAHERRTVNLKAAREQVVVPLLEELDWTPTTWASKAGVNASVTLDYLAGKSTLRRLSRIHLTTALENALKPKKILLPE
jgi:hypothetical protein